VDFADGAVGKCFGVEVGGFFGVVGVPEAEGVFVHFGLLCWGGIPHIQGGGVGGRHGPC
jgi:hypothetical protein